MDSNQLFAQANWYYWVAIAVIMSTPLVFSIYKIIRKKWILPKNELGIVAIDFPDNHRTFSIFGRQKTIHAVGFRLSRVAQQVFFREFGEYNNQVFYQQVEHSDWLLLKKAGIGTDIDLSAVFSNNKFGFLYFLQFKAKINPEKVSQAIINAQKNSKEDVYFGANVALINKYLKKNEDRLKNQI